MINLVLFLALLAVVPQVSARTSDISLLPARTRCSRTANATLAMSTSTTTPMSLLSSSSVSSSLCSTKTSSFPKSSSSSSSSLSSTKPSSSSKSSSSSFITLSSTNPFPSFTNFSSSTWPSSTTPSSMSFSSSSTWPSSTTSSSFPITSKPHMRPKETFRVSHGKTYDSPRRGGFYISGGPGGGFLAFQDLAIVFAVAAGALADVEIGPDGEPSTSSETTTKDTTTEESTSTTTSISSTSSSTTSSSSSSSSATATPSTYIIFPKDGSNSVANANFEKRLQGLSQPNSISDIPLENGVAFWTANLTTYNATKVQGDSYVENCFPNEPLDIDWEVPETNNSISNGEIPVDLSDNFLNQSTTELNPRALNCFIQQTDAPTELKIVSQPRGVDRRDLRGYDYRCIAGQGITIYVLDTGANLQNTYFRGMPGEIRWIFVRDFDQTQADEKNHGTCVLSKAVSPKYGTAKKANMVIVKMPSVATAGSWELGAMIEELDFLEALVKILNDVRAYSLQGKAVVNISWGFTLRHNQGGFPEPGGFINRMARLLLDIIQEDVAIVVASGNSRPLVDGVSRYPAFFWWRMPLVVVGAIEAKGIRTWYSQGTAGQLSSSAVGDVICPHGTRVGLQTKSGTSYAAPQIAGVAALILSDKEFYGYTYVAGSVARDVKSIIEKLSYPRSTDEPSVIWNGVNNYDCCGCIGQRDENSSQCSRSSTSTSTGIAPSMSTFTNTVTDTTITSTTTTATTTNITDVVTPTTTPLTPCSQLFLSSNSVVYAAWNGYSYREQNYYLATETDNIAKDKFDCMSQCTGWSCIFWTYIANTSAYDTGCWMWFLDSGERWNGTNPWHPSPSGLSGFIWGTQMDYCSTCGRNAQGCGS